MLPTYASLHPSAPSSDGTPEISGGSPEYVRAVVVWGPDTGGGVHEGQAVFDVPKAVVTHVAIWDADNVTYLGALPIDNGDVTNQSRVTVNLSWREGAEPGPVATRTYEAPYAFDLATETAFPRGDAYYDPEAAGGAGAITGPLNQNRWYVFGGLILDPTQSYLFEFDLVPSGAAGWSYLETDVYRLLSEGSVNYAFEHSSFNMLTYAISPPTVPVTQSVSWGPFSDGVPEQRRPAFLCGPGGDVTGVRLVTGTTVAGGNINDHGGELNEFLSATASMSVAGTTDTLNEGDTGNTGLRYRMNYGIDASTYPASARPDTLAVGPRRTMAQKTGTFKMKDGRPHA